MVLPTGISVSHVVGDLLPNTTYNVKVNGIFYNNYTSNNLGQISFNYTIGSSQNTFEVQSANLNSTTTVMSSVNPSVSGQSINFTAVVSSVPPTTGTPTGTVTFNDGNSALGTTTLTSGQATYFISALSIGVHPITAVYSGDNSYSGSTSSILNQHPAPPPSPHPSPSSPLLLLSPLPSSPLSPLLLSLSLSLPPPSPGLCDHALDRMQD